MKLRPSCLLALTAISLSVLTTAFGEIQPGARRDEVYRIMGYPDSSAQVGQMETITYKDGTKITLRNGVVEEVTMRGLVRIGNSTKIVPVPTARNSTTAKLQTQTTQGSPVSKAPTSTVEKTEPLPAQTTARMSKSETQVTKLVTGASQNTKNSNAQKAQPQPLLPALGGLGNNIDRINKAVAGLLVVFAVLSVPAYLFTCFCYKRICEKTGVEPGVLVWIPVAQFIPLLQVAKLPNWVLVTLLVPLVNIVTLFMLWGRICSARGKSPWLAATLIVPFAGFVLIPYLAFSGGNPPGPETQPVCVPSAPPATESAESMGAEPANEESEKEAPTEQTVPA